MLCALDIRDLLLIDRLSLAFGPGLSTLTGETGAGKSILLDALGFALGWRGRGEGVRAGAEAAEVAAVFALAPDHPARAVLEEGGVPAGPELILRRRLAADGRRQAWANDRRIGPEALRALGATLVELHGQHDDRGLYEARGQRALLDRAAGATAAAEAVRRAWAERRSAEAAAEEARRAAAALEAERDFLAHAVDELDRLAPEPGEADRLDAQRRRMQAAARIRDEIARAHAGLGPQGADGPLAEAIRRLDAVAALAEGRLDAALDAAGRAREALSEAEAAVERALEALEDDPRALEATEERLFALRAAARKHAVQPDELAALAVELRGRLARVEGAGDAVAAAGLRLRRAREAHLAACAELTRLRAEGAARLEQAMAAELPPLKLDRARFAVLLTPAEPGPEGAETVTFAVATAPGLPAGPIDRIASGGELSRFLLALKLCLRDGEGGATQIFDEIDRGIGGATADAVGRRLARLAEVAQVLVVTHSPQVAAWGGAQWRVEKAVSGEGAVTRVHPLGPEERVDEIARMLSGDRISAAAREAARALLAAAA